MKISIIVPVYNVEQYLDECINSVLYQSFGDYELILINDGSTDRSGEICDYYAKKDARVKVFHTANAGVSAARNLGLLYATGEWIIFLDSDDKIGVDYFKFLEDSDFLNADWIFTNVTKFNENTQESLVDFPFAVLEKPIFLEKYKLFPTFSAPWAKFFKREIIINMGLKFDTDLHLGEDAVFNLEYLYHVKIVKLTNFGIYWYRDIPNSLGKKKLNLIEDADIYNRLKQLLEKQNLAPHKIERHLSYAILRYFSSILNSTDNFSIRIKHLTQLLKDHNAYIYNNNLKEHGSMYFLNPLIKYRCSFLLVLIFTIKNQR